MKITRWACASFLQAPVRAKVHEKKDLGKAEASRRHLQSAVSLEFYFVGED